MYPRPGLDSHHPRHPAARPTIAETDAGMLRRKILKQRYASLIACFVPETRAGRVILLTDGC
jgi:hypothetical protein